MKKIGYRDIHSSSGAHETQKVDTTIRDLTALRAHLKTYGLDIAVSAKTWDTPSFGLIDKKASLGRYDERRINRFPPDLENLVPGLPKPAEKTDNAPKNNINRTKLIEAIKGIGKLSPDEITELTAISDKLIERTNISIRRGKNIATFQPLQIGLIFENAAAKIPASLKVIGAVRKIIAILNRYAELYNIVGEHDCDRSTTVTDRERQKLSTFLGAEDLDHKNIPWGKLWWKCLNLAGNSTIQKEIQQEITAAEVSPAYKLALNFVFLDLTQKMATAMAPGAGTFDLPLVAQSHKIDTAGFHQTIEENRLPEGIWRQQKEALTALDRALQKGERRIFIEAPPGTGKTEMIKLAIENLNRDGRTLIIEPTIALCTQTAAALNKSGIRKRDISIIAGDCASFDHKIVIGTYHSMVQYIKLGLVFPEEFAGVFPDECHRALSEERALIMEHFAQSLILGTTGSSTDIKGRNVSDELTPIYRIRQTEGMRAGIVNPTRLWVRKSGQTIEEKCEEILRCLGEICQDEQVLITLNGIANIEKAAEILGKAGIKCKAIHSSLPGGFAAAREAKFRDKQFQVALVDDMLTEGWDYPELRFLIMGDISPKEWIFTQQFGRIGRILPGKKPSGLIVLDNGKTNLHAISATLGINPRKHEPGSIIIEPDNTWPTNPILI